MNKELRTCLQDIPNWRRFVSWQWLSHTGRFTSFVWEYQVTVTGAQLIDTVCKGDTGTQFACFTSTKVQLLTQKAIHRRFFFLCAAVYHSRTVLSQLPGGRQWVHTAQGRDEDWDHDETIQKGIRSSVRLLPADARQLAGSKECRSKACQ